MLRGYLALCERANPLSVQEAQKLNSVETVALLGIARERVQDSIRSQACTGGQMASSERLSHEVADVFGLSRVHY
jgi:hypothetical protein